MLCRMIDGVSLPGSRLSKRATAWIWVSSGTTRCWTTTTCPTRRRVRRRLPANLEEAVDLLMSVVKELRALEVQD